MSKRKVQSHTKEFKVSSAKMVVESDQPAVHTANALGISPATLHGWIKRYYPKDADNKQLQSIDLIQELKQLKKENTRLRQERDILKKAAAYFAKETI